MPATLREMHLGRAAVEAPEVGEAQLVLAAAGRRWPWPRPYAVLLITMGSRPLSSMDRAPDFGSGGCEFESCSGYQRSRRSAVGRMAKFRVKHCGPQAIDFHGSAVRKQLFRLGFVTFNLG